VTSTDGTVIANHVECFNKANKALEKEASTLIHEVANSVKTHLRCGTRVYYIAKKSEIVHVISFYSQFFVHV
jgi:hypothetical protein